MNPLKNRYQEGITHARDILGKHLWNLKAIKLQKAGHTGGPNQCNKEKEIKSIKTRKMCTCLYGRRHYVFSTPPYGIC